MAWKKARQSVRDRMAANRRKYREAPLRDALEAQARHTLATTSPAVIVFTSEHFRPVERDGQRRWLLLPQLVSNVRRQAAKLGPAMYCRACGADIPEGAPRIYFKFRWVSTDATEKTGCVHHVECVRVTEI
jgi:hypothetical protein